MSEGPTYHLSINSYINLYINLQIHSEINHLINVVVRVRGPQERSSGFLAENQLNDWSNHRRGTLMDTIS